MNDANDDVAQRLDRLESKDAIRELTASYCFAVAEGRGADIVAMFTGDGRHFSGICEHFRIGQRTLEFLEPGEFLVQHFAHLKP